MNKILIVEDDVNINNLLKEALSGNGYTCGQAFSGTEAALWLEKESWALVLLDLMLPGMTGEEVLGMIRRQGNVPVIVLTAKDAMEEKLELLTNGADDYITKPFEPMELIARVNSNLRRYEQILNLKGSTQKPSNQLIVGGLVLDQATKEVFVNGQSVRLTKKEFQILELLMSYPGKVYSAEEIYESIWEETAINTETIMVHVRRLREKIEANPKHPEYLKAVWGVGYKIEKME